MASPPSRDGPISTPAIRYDVTSGKCQRLSGRVSRSPAKIATDRDNKTVIAHYLVSKVTQYYICGGGGAQVEKRRR